MEPHQQRAVDEHADLEGKLERLGAFFDNPIFDTLPEEERRDLFLQEEAMKRYAHFLSRRISRF